MNAPNVVISEFSYFVRRLDSNYQLLGHCKQEPEQNQPEIE